MYPEMIIILALILANGVFAMAEIAIVSARKARLKVLHDKGDRGAGQALELANSPNRLLSTVQIGITLISTLAGAYGGATIAEQLAVFFGGIPYISDQAELLGIAAVVLAITFVSLLLGELVPKRLALHSPERISSLVAGPMYRISILAGPMVSFLSACTEMVLRVLRVRPSQEPPVTEDEVRLLIDLGVRHGVFEEAEKDIVERVFLLGDRRASSIMTPRSEIIWIDMNDPIDQLSSKIAAHPHLVFPVGRGSLDNILGVVGAGDLLACRLRDRPLDILSCLRSPLLVPENERALGVLELFRKSGSHVALLVDEYGSAVGMVTLTDILEAMVGDLPFQGDLADPKVVRRPDGSLLLDGLISSEEFKELLGVRALPDEQSGYYQTLGGFVMNQLGRVPKTGDSFWWDEFHFEVVDMDENRVDRVIVSFGFGARE
ncbi:MAG: hypothetical protein A4E45_00281 [Methanosaeta sp. PtaB.Bin039]|nr:MAG: hypothetical protein A4E45_00281 [Methanosaeta sp. PtaB.Bin039]OPY45488.1 MAG: hypothetical protein A4E47_00962 [Methanosaeta sp. PtaU1.Bin028]HOT07146.1 hemolysin family protein [Methanotrichaceae archaeon]